MEKNLYIRATEGLLQEPEIREILENPFVPSSLKRLVRDNYDLESDEEYSSSDSFEYSSSYRLEELSDGESIEILVRPSGLPTHHRYARRLTKKFNVSDKVACLVAYILYYVANLNKEVCDWFENFVMSEGWDNAFAYIFTLFSELRKEGGVSTDALGRVEDTLPDATEFAYIPLVCEDTEWKISEESEKFNCWFSKINRAGVNNIGSVGKEMYSQRLTGSYELDRVLWKLYRERKSELQKYRKA